jgi:hypothetical protein
MQRAPLEGYRRRWDLRGPSVWPVVPIRPLSFFFRFGDRYGRATINVFDRIDWAAKYWISFDAQLNPVPGDNALAQ